MPLKTGDPIIPATAVEMKVVKYLNPYQMIGYDVKEHKKILVQLSKILPKMVLTNRKHQTHLDTLVENGTKVILRGRIEDWNDIPCWWCRGEIIGSCKDDENKLNYDVYLIDFGKIVKIDRSEFTTVPSESFNDYPSMAINFGLYNILPAYERKKKIDKNSTELVIVKKWQEEAINLTLQLLSASKITYFNQIAVDENKKKYGEIYLSIDDRICALRKILVYSCLATYVSPEIRTILTNINNGKNIKNEIIITNNVPYLEPFDTKNISDKSSNTKSSSSSSSETTKFAKNSNDYLIVSKVQVDGLPCLAEAKFPYDIHKNLSSMKITSLRNIQSLVWPAITKGLDVLAIGPTGCGKTLSYVPPISSIIAKTRNERYDTYPMALVICANTNDVIDISNLFQGLLENYDKINIISAYNGRPDRTISSLIINGCHIIVSTAPYLLRYLSKDESHCKILNLKYLRHIIVDRVDVILEKHKKPLTELFKKYTPIGRDKFRNMENTTIQFIAVAEKWSTNVGQFAGLFTNPYTCITSFPDAVICCGIKPVLRLIHKIDKSDKIIQLLGDNWKTLKTVIVCTNKEEVNELKKSLSSTHDLIILDEDILNIEKNKQLWNISKCGTYSILICTDSLLSEIGIRDADWLIHYSVSTKTKSIFYNRFVTLMDKLKNEKQKLVTIFIDETNDEQLRGVIDLIKRSGGKLLGKELQSIEKICANWDRKKKEYSLCDNVKSLGTCTQIGKCPYRHFVLTNIDSPITPIVIGYKIKMIITWVHSATHFSARIFEYKNMADKIYKLDESQHLMIPIKIQSYLSRQENREIPRIIEVGGIYGYDEGFKNYKRVQVIHIISRDKFNAPLYVAIRIIDTGMIVHKIRVSQLLKLSDDLINEPQNIMEIFIANILPYDDEEEWSNAAGLSTKEWLKKHVVGDAFLQGKVLLHLGNTFWVDSLDITDNFPGRSEDVTIASLQKHLIKCRYGIYSERHMNELMKICPSEEIDNTPTSISSSS
ncbi:hypothetical protein HCN44_005398 [Aphidius gifuensis]|uniref:RNA helicase n=1 Tax=Aphidius gifuensis TaxID=684658 RepID=A0A834Y1V4_APHGI|nr:hypothetical protein HCN44_005398 [Aphidius gifuensis]